MLCAKLIYSTVTLPSLTQSYIIIIISRLHNRWCNVLPNHAAAAILFINPVSELTIWHVALERFRHNHHIEHNTYRIIRINNHIPIPTMSKTLNNKKDINTIARIPIIKSDLLTKSLTPQIIIVTVKSNVANSLS